VLLTSCAEAGIQNILACFPYVESLVMWIDPGEVAVKIVWSYSQVAKEEVIYPVNKSRCYPGIITLPATPPSILFSKPSFQQVLTTTTTTTTTLTDDNNKLCSRVSDDSSFLKGMPSNHSQDQDVPYYIQQVWMGSEENVFAS
jgi:hypothetical protein